MDTFNQFADFPGWAIALIAVLGLLVIVTRVVAVTFAVCYAFFWKNTRDWFNRKAGSDFMPAKRIERPQLFAAAAGAVMLILNLILDAVPKGEGPSVVKILSANLSTLLIIAFLIYTVSRYRKRAYITGKQQARWEAIYLFLSCVTIFAASGLAFALFIMLMAALFLLDKGFDFTHKNLHGGATSDGTAASSGKEFACDHIRLLDGHCYQSGQKCTFLTDGTCPYGKNR